MSTTDPAFEARLAEHEAEQAAKYEAMKAELTAEIAAMTGEELSEQVAEAEEHRSIAQAEHGMGAISMGWRNGEFEQLQTPRLDLFISLGHERLAELYPPAPAPAPAMTVAEDDLPF